MKQATVTQRIERELERAGLYLAVEDSDGALILSGRVDTAEDSQAAEDIVRELAPGRRIDNQLEVELVLPETVGDRTSEEPSETDLPDSVGQLREWGGDIEPDFTEQRLFTDASEEPGPTSWGPEDAVAEGDEPYVPPTDPVITTGRHGEAEVLGGTSPDSMDSVEVEPSAEDNVPGDEALADAIRRELREDAATTELRIEVLVRQGVVHLRGSVPSLDDADNAGAVAARVPGVRDVMEELEVAALE
jgi:osmotically-inducible protein OsmY